MSRTFEFDLVTAFNASSLNISETNFKAANPNEFYLVSVNAQHCVGFGNVWLTNKGRRSRLDDDFQWSDPSGGSGTRSVLLRHF
jgi:hypothetical protein